MQRYDALLTDLYQLTMLQSYHANRMNEVAVFEFFVRKLPPERAFLVAAGLQQALEYLVSVRFSDEEIQYLANTKRFTADFLEYLAHWRFQGDVDAMPEGTIFFSDEPILRVTAPMPQAQLVESRLINILHYQTLIASKAVRCRMQAPDKLLVDFGLRRAHGGDAGLVAARASFIAGFNGTATVLAGMKYGIPIFGTMAHSFVQAHQNEDDAFIDFSLSQPDNVVLLIDTYQTERAAERLGVIAKKLAEKKIKIKGVRLDSGDLAEHAHKVRAILDSQGLQNVTIFCSGSIDEYELRELLLVKQAPIDGFGIGTLLDTSVDVPFLDCAYKLQEYAGIARRKRSEGKATWPGRKQVYRYYDKNGKMNHDLLTVADDRQDGKPLLVPVMKKGEAINNPVAMGDIRENLLREIETLPSSLTKLTRETDYSVVVSDALRQLASEVDQSFPG